LLCAENRFKAQNGGERFPVLPEAGTAAWPGMAATAGTRAAPKMPRARLRRTAGIAARAGTAATAGMAAVAKALASTNSPAPRRKGEGLGMRAKAGTNLSTQSWRSRSGTLKRRSMSQASAHRLSSASVGTASKSASASSARATGRLTSSAKTAKHRHPAMERRGAAIVFAIATEESTQPSLGRPRTTVAEEPIAT
jgi:hypothetical protein